MAVPTATTGAARDAAVNLIKFLGDTLAQEAELTEVSNFPALMSVYASPPAGEEWIMNFTDQLPLTLSRPVHHDYPLISDVIADYFSDMLSCQKDVDTALKEMERDLEDIVGTPPLPPVFSFPEADILVSLVYAVIALGIISVVFNIGIILVILRSRK